MVSYPASQTNIKFSGKLWDYSDPDSPVVLDLTGADLYMWFKAPDGTEFRYDAVAEDENTLTDTNIEYTYDDTWPQKGDWVVSPGAVFPDESDIRNTGEIFYIE